MAENQSVSIEMLNNDCMIEIFRYLSIADRLNIETVNARWSHLSKSSWSHVKKLKFNPLFWGFRRSRLLHQGLTHIRIDHLEKVFERCGQYLEEIDASNDWISTNSRINLLSLIGNYCPNIKFITVDCNLDGIDALAKCCKNIVSLRFLKLNSQNSHFYKDELRNLFNNNKNLRILEFKYTPNFTGSCLLNLSSLELLKLNYVDQSLDTDNLIDSINVMSNLKILRLNLQGNQINDVIMALINRSSFEEIGIDGNYSEADFPDGETKLGKLLKNNNKLRILSLEYFSLNGRCLINLNADNFEKLSLNDCKNFDCSYLNVYFFKFNNLSSFTYEYCSVEDTDQNELFIFISALKNLKYLKILGNERVLNDVNLTSMSSLNLEQLHLEGPFITDDFLITLADCLKNLKNVTLFCSKVTNAGLFAITSLQKLEYLHIYFATQITGEGFNKMKNLKHLKLCDAYQIEINNNFKKILNESRDLEYLEVEDCPHIDPCEFILFLNEITKQRTNNIILYIPFSINDGLTVTQKMALRNIEKSPFLQII